MMFYGMQGLVSLMRKVQIIVNVKTKMNVTGVEFMASHDFLMVIIYIVRFLRLEGDDAYECQNYVPRDTQIS
jgi:hypothetical protein